MGHPGLQLQTLERGDVAPGQDNPANRLTWSLETLINTLSRAQAFRITLSRTANFGRPGKQQGKVLEQS
eukprot:1157161-Pelagomonas_calceolata.AAC.3